MYSMRRGKDPYRKRKKEGVLFMSEDVLYTESLFFSTSVSENNTLRRWLLFLEESTFGIYFS